MNKVSVQRSPFSKLPLVIFVALLATQASASSFLSTNNVTVGAALKITCNADVVGLDQSISSIAGASLARKTPRDEDFKYMLTVNAILFAIEDEQYKVQIQPENGSDWSYTLPADSLLEDENSRYARDTISITAFSDSLQLADAGIYLCVITTRINREFDWTKRYETLVINGSKQAFSSPSTIALSLVLQVVLLMLSLTCNQDG